MGYSSTDSHSALTILQGCLLVSVQADLYDELLTGIREQTLDKVYSKTVRGVVFDMSTVKVMDTYVFKHLAETARMALVLGVGAVFSGFRPGVVSALVDMNVDLDAVKSFRTCEEALEHFTAHLSMREPLDNDDENGSLSPNDDELESEYNDATANRYA